MTFAFDQQHRSKSPTGAAPHQHALPGAGPPFPGNVQRKVAIGSVDDPQEYEADRVADQMMGMRDPAISIGAAPVQISRQCTACEGEFKSKLPVTPTASQPRTDAGPGILHAVLQSPGQPLDAGARAYFEPRFGHDFSVVRVHADDRAAESADSIGASAYTAGSNIAFAAGRYDPATPSGRRLLAHELTHVVQQRAPNSSCVSSEAAFIQRDADSDDFKLGYEQGRSGGESQAGSRDGDALTDYNEGYAKGRYEFSQQKSSVRAPSPTASEAPTPAPSESPPGPPASGSPSAASGSGLSTPGASQVSSAQVLGSAGTAGAGSVPDAITASMMVPAASPGGFSPAGFTPSVSGDTAAVLTDDVAGAATYAPADVGAATEIAGAGTGAGEAVSVGGTALGEGAVVAPGIAEGTAITGTVISAEGTAMVGATTVATEVVAVTEATVVDAALVTAGASAVSAPVVGLIVGALIVGGVLIYLATREPPAMVPGAESTPAHAPGGEAAPAQAPGAEAGRVDAPGADGTEISEPVADTQNECEELTLAGKRHQHHIFPREYEHEFYEIGIEDVDMFVISVKPEDHRTAHGRGQWNNEWADFFADLPTHTLSEAEKEKWREEALDVVSSQIERMGWAHLKVRPFFPVKKK